MTSGLLLLFVLVTNGCSGGGGGTPTTPASRTFTVSGMVSGVSVGGLKLTLNGSQEITIHAAGPFSFTAPLPDGSGYNVQVSQNPTAPPQTCTLSGQSGIISGADVTNVNVVCSALTLTILDTASTTPGALPVVDFQVSQNGVPMDILAAPLGSLKATISGPTTDYASYWQARLQGTGATGTLAVLDAAAGTFRYTFSSAIPGTATGSYALALEGYIVNGDYPGIRFSAVSPIRFFAVTDATPAARRTVVDDAKCNACHATIAVHGGNTRGVQYCALCHNANLSNDGQVARFEGATIIAPSLDMKVLIHKIHRGQALTQQPYLIGGFPGPSPANPAGTAIPYGEVVYPGDLRDCQACHLPGTFDIPLAPGTLPATSRAFTSTEPPTDDLDNYCNSPFFTLTDTFRTPPISAACTSCHDAIHTVAHAATMTTGTGTESCQTCHGAGAAYGAERYHVPGR